MLSAHAHSFRHKSRLAVSLSWVAGYVNVILLIACGQTVSHQTGNTTRFGSSMGNLILQKPGAASEVFLFSTLIGLFLLGSLCSGWMIEAAQRAGRRSQFLFPMILEAILLSSLVLLLERHPQLSFDDVNDRRMLSIVTGIAALAMGLQNATITRISGAVVRTTHLTGVITDLGLELVQLWHWWRDKNAAKTVLHVAVQRVLLLGCIFGSFLFGVTAGSVLFEKIGPIALLAPVLFLTGLILKSFFWPTEDENEREVAGQQAGPPGDL